MNQSNHTFQDSIPLVQGLPVTYSREQIELIKRQVAKGCNDDELKLFIMVCQKSGLDPFTRQIYAIKNPKKPEDKMHILTSIDGFRLIAQRTGDYEGQVGPLWCGQDGVWKDVWIERELPRAARVGVYRKGFKDVLWAVANFDAYAVYFGGELNRMWNKMPELMIAKCAEALALRKAFPNELSGMYTSDEIHVDQSDDEPKEALKPSEVPAVKIVPKTDIKEVVRQTQAVVAENAARVITGQEPAPMHTISEAQIRLYHVKVRGINPSLVREYLEENFHKTYPEQLVNAELNQLIEAIAPGGYFKEKRVNAAIEAMDGHFVKQAVSSKVTPRIIPEPWKGMPPTNDEDDPRNYDSYMG